MSEKKDCSEYLRPIREDEVRDWRPSPKGFSTELFETFVKSSNQMVEVKVDALPEPKHRKGSKVESTKQDSFASSFYSWKRKKSTKNLLKKLGTDVLLIRRGEKIALKKKRFPS